MNTWKKRVSLALVGLGFVMLGKGTAQAAASADISVQVQVQVVSVSVASTTWLISNAGSVVPGSVHTSSAIYVTNDANQQEDFQLSLDDLSAWSTPDDTPGTDEYALLAVFTGDAAATMNNDDFASNDRIIEDTTTTATANIYAIDGQGAGVKGFDVDFGTTRNLFLNFRTPTSNTQVATQFITVTVSAIAS